MPNGEIQPECVERLQKMGAWLSAYGHTIYDTEKGFVTPKEWGAVTSKGKTSYLHVLSKNENKIVVNIPSFKSAKWANIDAKLSYSKLKETGDILFDLTDIPFDEIDSIIEITHK